ncbi:hypothetical protein GCM10010112_76140 [Actinoplanes lobatus]|uniref:Anaphase-promoting complex subunit 5 domain-containing protein n=1 Tax=Actinoplanes lobatus TaxID=113568 RepID=A0ABQ4ASK4_9ACTN|nr:hypothetical protein GCM10010112_76140 [Actinoplanes lobatus]GIE43958.1 hypothetical protein Alo02nite_68560 [Actinoplanes lobatus]
MVFGDVVQITDVRGAVTVSTVKPPYRVAVMPTALRPLTVEQARAQPSRLLLARHQVVPFTGRDRALATLTGWMGNDDPVAVQLVHGAGGQGKTRLADELSARYTAAGWTVWQVTHTSTTASRVPVPGSAVLAVVDYADRWPASALLALLTQLRGLQAQAGIRIRVLLLGRSDGYWWPALANRADGDLHIETTQMALPPLAADSADDRPALFRTAAARFAAALGVERSGDWPVPSMSGNGFGQVLAVHMAALAAVDASRHGQPAPTQPHAVSAYLLNREQDYWHRLHTRAEAPVQSPPETMHRAVVVATLTGARPRATARTSLLQAGFAETRTGADRIIDDHLTCYPPADTRTVFEPLHPDRLGEDLIALSTPGHGAATSLQRDWTPEAITALLGGEAPPEWTATVVTVLVETAHRWPHIAADLLFPLVREHPELAVAAGGATLIRLAGIADVDLTALEALEPLLPGEPHIDLDIAAAAISSRLTPHRLARTTDPFEQSQLHFGHAYRLMNIGQNDQALVAAEEAVTICRRLVADDANTYLPFLALSLTNFGAVLPELGRWEQSLTVSGEAADIYRRLAEDDDPGLYLPLLAVSAHNLGACLSELGRWEQALDPAGEATAIYRRLAAADPETHLSSLAGSLSGLGTVLARLGRLDESLTVAEEAAVLGRRSAAHNPQGRLPDLAMSLTNLGTVLSDLGRSDEALTVTEEATALYRRLAGENPDAYLPDLATSLSNLGSRLSARGRWEQGLSAAEEAEEIYRRLAEENPDVHLSGLAMSLTNFGPRLFELGRREQGLTMAEEAVAISRRLAESNPDAHLPGLAIALSNLGAFLLRLGRREQGLLATEEAVAVRRRLAEKNPDAHLPDLAGSLTNLGLGLSELGRRDQGLAAAEEAVAICWRLAEKNPDAHLAGLAMSLINLSVALSGMDRDQEALAAKLEALDLYRWLAEADPDAWLPGLAVTLRNLGLFLSELGRCDHGLVPAEEAVAVFRRLAEENPDVHLSGLAEASSLLGACLSELGRCAEGLTHISEAVAVFRGLAEMDQQTYLPHLAMSLNNLGACLSQLDRYEQALPPAEEAVAVYRRLAGDDPYAVSDLAGSLSVHARVCAHVTGGLSRAFESITEAIRIYESLAPDRFAGELRWAHLILADVLDGLGRSEEATEVRERAG